MATIPHPTEDSLHPRNGNHFDPLLEWFGVPPDRHSIYALLDIDPEETNVDLIKGAADSRIAYLKQHLSGPHGAVARMLTQKIAEARDCVLDPQRRASYNKRVRGKHPERLISYHTHGALFETLPEIVEHKEEPPSEDVLSGIGKQLKRKPWIVYTAAAGVLGGIIALLTRQGGTPLEKPVTPSVRILPPNAPEFTQGPLPPPSPIVLQPGTADAPTVEPKPLLIPPPTPETFVNPAPSSSPKAKETPVPNTSAPVVQPEETPNPTQPKPPVHSPVPTNEELEPYRDLLKSPTLAKLTTEQLLEQAQRSNNPAEQWALLHIALRNARSKRNLDQTMAVLSETQKYFDTDDQVIEESVAVVREAAQQKGGNTEQVMIHASSVVRTLCVQNKLDEAKKFIIGLKDRPSANRKECLDIMRILAQLKKCYEEEGIAGHQQTLVDHPLDPDANHAVGAYHCFKEGDWSYVSALQVSNDPTLRSLADRVESRETLSSANLLQLAKDILATDTGHGAGIMAMHCLKLAEPKSGSTILTARIKDFRAELGRQLTSSLPFFRGTLQNTGSSVGSLQQPTSESIALDVSAMLPTGMANLIGDNPETFLKKGFIVRDRWQMATEKTTPILKGTSGNQLWIASINFPLTTESQKIIQSGQYSWRFAFKRTAEGRWPDGLHGATIFMIPLPNGQTIPVIWDGNMNKKTPNVYRSGFGVEGIEFFEPRQPSPSFADHTSPVVSDGDDFVCTATVQTVQKGMFITATLTKVDEKKTQASLSLAVSPATKGGPPYFFREGERRMPSELGTPVGFGIGGGTIYLRGEELSPLNHPPKNIRR